MRNNINIKNFIKDFSISKLDRITFETKCPQFLTLAITEKCNSKCIMCNIWKQKPLNELNLSDYESLFHNKEFWKSLKHVSITGGEPFLNNDLIRIIKLITNINPKISLDICTNGLSKLLIANKTKEILMNNPKIDLEISLSLDNLGEEYNQIRGIKNAFELAIETLKELKKLRELYSQLKISISFTIMKENYNSLLDVYNFAVENNLSFCCRPIHLSPHYYKNSSNKYSWSEEEIEQIKLQIKSIDVGYRNIFVSQIPLYLNGTKKMIVPCYSLFYSIFINSYGNVYPCLYWDRLLCNLKSEKIDIIWNSEKFKELRKEIKKEKCPKCWSECETNKSFYFDGFNYFKLSLMRCIKK